MRQIKLKATIAGPNFSADEGDVIDVASMNSDNERAEMLADSLIDGGYAEEYHDTTKKEQKSKAAEESAAAVRAREPKRLTLDDAISLLDDSNDYHWTKDGKPAMAVLEGLTGNPSLSRDDVEAAYPDLRRHKQEQEQAPREQTDEKKRTKGRRSNRP